MANEFNIDAKHIESFLTKVLALEKRYAHELKSANSDRRTEIIELVNAYSSKELEPK